MAPKVRSRSVAALLGLTMALHANAALAHHSFAIFDHSRTYTITGTVQSFQWTNPHGYLELAVLDGLEGVPKFTVELTSVNMLRRAGWRSTDVKAGDEVIAIVAPLASGEPGGLLLELRVPDGRTLVPPVPAIDTFKRTP